MFLIEDHVESFQRLKIYLCFDDFNVIRCVELTNVRQFEFARIFFRYMKKKKFRAQAIIP